jgi:hypothetical protein
MGLRSKRPDPGGFVPVGPADSLRARTLVPARAHGLRGRAIRRPRSGAKRRPRHRGNDTTACKRRLESLRQLWRPFLARQSSAHDLGSRSARQPFRSRRDEPHPGRPTTFLINGARRACAGGAPFGNPLHAARRRHAAIARRAGGDRLRDRLVPARGWDAPRSRSRPNHSLRPALAAPEKIDATDDHARVAEPDSDGRPVCRQPAPSCRAFGRSRPARRHRFSPRSPGAVAARR